MSIRYEGVCKWFSSKGESFGYINGFQTDAGSTGEIFVHYSQIGTENQENPKFKLLKKGDRVSFEIGPGYPSAKSGTQAINVVRLP